MYAYMCVCVCVRVHVNICFNNNNNNKGCNNNHNKGWNIQYTGGVPSKIYNARSLFFRQFLQIIFAELGHQLTANRSLERKLDNLAIHCAYN